MRNSTYSSFSLRFLPTTMRLTSVFCVVLLCGFAVSLSAQSVSFAGAQTVLGSGFNLPFGVAVDGSGNVFVADSYNLAVKEILAAGGYTAVNTLGSGFSYPRGVAVDGSGNVFVADTDNYAVKEILAAGGYTTVKTLSVSRYYLPSGVAVDGNGNVFVADTNNNAVKEILAVGGYTTVNTLGSGFNEPWGVAVDGNGNVFVADTFNKAVKEILAAGGYTTVNTLGSGFDQPFGVAVDGSGNVFVTEVFTNAVKEILAVGGYTTVNTIGSDFSAAVDVAVDGSGNLFVTEGLIVELQFGSADFGNVNICPSAEPAPAGCSKTVAMNYNVSGSGTLGTPLVLTGGAPGLDFTPANGSTCIGSVAAGTTCTVNVAFSPQAPGVRNGSVEITDGGGNVLATTSVHGFGQSPPSGPPVAQISTALLHFSNIAFGGSETLPLTITNIGGGTLTIAPSIDGPSYVIAGNACSSGVLGGGSCVLTVQFAPVRVGFHHDTLTLQNNGTSTPVISLTGSGRGVGPKTEEPLNFGTIPFGTSTVLPLTITNEGVASTVTVSTSVSSDPSFKVLTNAQNTCLAGIFFGQSCILPVEFAPAWVGVHSNHVTVTPSGGGASSTVPLYGIAAAAP